MGIEEAVQYAITGNALLFCGSGFSVGATSINGKPLPIGKGLCELLKKELGILDDDDDIEYYSTKFIEKYDYSKLIKLLKDNFTISSYKEYHEVISNIDWRRIYTTNYDNLIEDSGKEYKRRAATLSDIPRENSNHKELVVHLNGSIHNLDRERLDNEFKLTMCSYSSTEFIESDWYEIFKNDIDSAKAIFFIGFSLKYDLDIRRAITSRKGIREKCFFIDSIHLTSKNEDILSKYGSVLKIGTDGFANIVKDISNSYVKPEGFKEPLYVFEEYDKVEPPYVKVRDEDVINLLCRGEYIRDLLIYNSINNKYVFRREAVKKVLDLIENGKRFIILESDFGNGKTCTLNILQYELSKVGNVFKLINIDGDISCDVDNILSSYMGKKFIIIDNYHHYFKVLDIMDKYNLDDCVFILSERSYINDTLYSDVLQLHQADEGNTSIISLNRLSNTEIESIIKLFNKYNLWGINSKWSYKEKKDYIKCDCNRELKDVLIGMFDAPIIKSKLQEILNTVRNNRNAEKIIIMSIIENLVNLDLNLDDYLYFLSMTEISLKIKDNDMINELIDIEENNIKVKSSILAQLIINNSNISDKIVDLLISIMNKLDKKRNTEKYRNVQFALISFSNIQLLIKEKGPRFNNLIIRYYENIKNTRYCNNNVFFWIQYANARISLKQFVEAKLCLKKAQSEMRDNRYYPQYETCYSRYLLENQLHYNIKERAYEIFEQAHNGIYNNKNSKDRWHFPLKQTNLYYEYYKKFYDTFTDTEKSLFILHCKEIFNKINDYIDVRKRLDGKINHRVIYAKRCIERILNTYITNEEVASTQ